MKRKTKVVTTRWDPAESLKTGRDMATYLEAALEDGQKLLWPATAPSINQTVVVW